MALRPTLSALALAIGLSLLPTFPQAAGAQPSAPSVS